MQIQAQLAITGYNEKKVNTALTMIKEKASNTRSKLNVVINGEPVKKNELLKNQPPLHGCDHRNITIFAVSVSGSLKDVKRLVDTDTPDGVMIEILPQTV